MIIIIIFLTVGVKIELSLNRLKSGPRESASNQLQKQKSIPCPSVNRVFVVAGWTTELQLLKTLGCVLMPLLCGFDLFVEQCLLYTRCDSFTLSQVALCARRDILLTRVNLFLFLYRNFVLKGQRTKKGFDKI